MESKPFALIGVNTNGYAVEKLKEVMDKEKLNWRSFAEKRGEDAYRSMLRFQQDYQPLERTVTRRFAEALLDLGLDRIQRAFHDLQNDRIDIVRTDWCRRGRPGMSLRCCDGARPDIHGFNVPAPAGSP